MVIILLAMIQSIIKNMKLVCKLFNIKITIKIYLVKCLVKIDLLLVNKNLKT